MPDVYMPGESLRQKINNLVQGFYLEVSDDNEIVLILKCEAATITSLIKGCPIHIVLRNPKLANRSITVYIYDHPTKPLWVTAENFSEESSDFMHFDEIAVDLLKAEKIRVAYFSEMNIPVFSTILIKQNDLPDFILWQDKLTRSKYSPNPVKDGYFLPEDELKGFRIKISNRDCSAEEKLKISPIEELEIWGEKSLNNSDYYDHNEFVSDGKHGYNQELSIRSILSRHFEPNDELFHSPLKTDNTELTDFIVEYKNAVMLIESKYILNDKQRQINKLLLKGVNQINMAERIIIQEPNNIKDERLREKLKSCEITLRICLFNGNIVLTEKNMQNIIRQFSKDDLPIFMSVSAFSQFLGTVRELSEERYKFNIIKNLLTRYENFMDSFDDILIIQSI